MRSIVFALVTLVVGCGDNIHPGVFVETKVASNTLAAGDRVGARCSIVNEHGDPVLDKKGNPLTDSTELVVSYEDMSSFATDASGVGEIHPAWVGWAGSEMSIACSPPECQSSKMRFRVTVGLWEE